MDREIRQRPRTQLTKRSFMFWLSRPKAPQENPCPSRWPRPPVSFEATLVHRICGSSILTTDGCRTPVTLNTKGFPRLTHRKAKREHPVLWIGVFQDFAVLTTAPVRRSTSSRDSAL